MKNLLTFFAFLLPTVFCGGARGADATAQGKFLRGDSNGDGVLSQADVISVIRYFHSGRLPPCADAADFDDSGSIDITDMVNLVAFVYFDGGYPADPYRTIGVDPTEDQLGCDLPLDGVPARMALEKCEARFDGDEDEGQVIDFLEFYYRRVSAYPGETGILVPIVLSTTTETEGFTVSVSTDPTKVWLERIEIPSSYPGGLKPELSPLYTERISEGYIALSVFMDYEPPFEGYKLPRSRDTVVAFLSFGLSPEVEVNEKFWIRFDDIPPRDDLRPTPMNEISRDGQFVRPALDSKGLEILIEPKATLFVRGDPNRDLALNITDVIVILRYLFGGEVLPCLDPADVDDSGKIDISDVILLAEFLFDRGSPPAMPFPNPGRDPSNDALTDCR